MGRRAVGPAGRTETGGAVDAIVVAAGASSRMGGIDKLATPLLGRPVLVWAIEAIAAAPEIGRIIVVLPADRIATTPIRHAPKVVAVVAGGARRQGSVAAGLAALEGLDRLDPPEGPPDRVVLVHDGARPLVPVALVGAVARAATIHGAAIPVVAVADTLKRVVDGRLAGTVDRTGLAAAQTPQGVRRSLLRTAFDRFPVDGPDEFTDEAALLEACRIPVHAVPGDPVNLKLTVPGDLTRAESFLAARQALRIGSGRDSHPFGPADGLRLGGVSIDAAPRLHGHSDGDVALHAISDALLGAAGLGDLGRLHPADDRTPTGIDSRTLLADVVRRVGESGWAPRSLDVTIIGARPRLGARLDAMRDAIAGLLGLDPSAVSVKASSGNLAGDAGAGRVIEASAVATLGPVARISAASS